MDEGKHLYLLIRVGLWVILALSLALLASNQERMADGVTEGLALAAFGCATVLMFDSILNLLS